MTKNPMTKLKTLSAAAILAAAVATPVFAQDAGPIGPGSDRGLEPQPSVTYHHARAYHHRSSFRGAYYRYDSEFRQNKENFGFSGRDRSRIGGQAAWLHPGG